MYLGPLHLNSEVAKQSQFAHSRNHEERRSQHLVQPNLPSFHPLAKIREASISNPVRFLIQEDKLLASNFPKHRVLEAITSSGVLNEI